MDKTEALLEEIKNADKAFREHWVWRELKCTPEVFFARLSAFIAKQGLPASMIRDIWQQLDQNVKRKLSKPKQKTATKPSYSNRL